MWNRQTIRLLEALPLSITPSLEVYPVFDDYNESEDFINVSATNQTILVVQGDWNVQVSPVLAIFWLTCKTWLGDNQLRKTESQKSEKKLLEESY